MDLANIIFLCWNVRGLNDKARRDSIRELVALYKATVVCFQETKIETFSPFLVAQCLGPSYDGFAYLPAVGTKGGILLAWDTSKIRADRVEIGKFTVSVQFKYDAFIPFWILLFMSLRTSWTKFFSLMNSRTREPSARVHGLSWGILTSFSTQKTRITGILTDE